MSEWRHPGCCQSSLAACLWAQQPWVWAATHLLWSCMLWGSFCCMPESLFLGRYDQDCTPWGPPQDSTTFARLRLCSCFHWGCVCVLLLPIWIWQVGLWPSCWVWDTSVHCCSVAGQPLCMHGSVAGFSQQSDDVQTAALLLGILALLLDWLC